MLRSAARALLPVRLRRSLRRAASQCPQRIRDLPADLASLVWISAFGDPLPPPALRARVGGVSRREFELVGREGAQAILGAFEQTRNPKQRYPAWLDFGCGCGRVARHLAVVPAVERLHGVDVDAAQIRWARRHLRGEFTTMLGSPPLDFEPASLDVVYAVSIFTHLKAEEQFAWLEEMRRILVPGGLLIATTHNPELSRTCPGLTAADLARLSESGFLAAESGGSFNERSTFHSAGYLEREWGRTMARRFYEPYGFVGYQDLSVWEKPEGA